MIHGEEKAADTVHPTTAAGAAPAVNALCDDSAFGPMHNSVAQNDVDTSTDVADHKHSSEDDAVENTPSTDAQQHTHAETLKRRRSDTAVEEESRQRRAKARRLECAAARLRALNVSAHSGGKPAAAGLPHHSSSENGGEGRENQSVRYHVEILDLRCIQSISLKANLWNIYHAWHSQAKTFGCFAEKC